MKGTALTLLAITAGFAFGVLWGQGTRKAAASNTTTDFSGGVLTVKADVYSALSQGLSAALSGR